MVSNCNAAAVLAVSAEVNSPRKYKIAVPSPDNIITPIMIGKIMAKAESKDVRAIDAKEESSPKTFIRESFGNVKLQIP